MAGQARTWFEWLESNVLWGGIGIVLLVVGAMKHDLRFLLWISLPCFILWVWSWAKHTNYKRIITSAAAVVIAAGITAMYVWLRPVPLVAAPSSVVGTKVPKPLASAPPAKRPTEKEKPKSRSRSQSGHDNQQNVQSGNGNQQIANATPSQSCPNGICNGSGTTVNGTQTIDNRQFGVQEPPPNIVNLVKKDVPPDLANKEGPPQEKNPGVSLTFTVDRIFANPIFLVRCDFACFVTSGYSGGASSPRPLTTNQREISGISIGTMGGLFPKNTVSIVVRSADSQPIHVLGVEAYIPPIK